MSASPSSLLTMRIGNASADEGFGFREGSAAGFSWNNKTMENFTGDFLNGTATLATPLLYLRTRFGLMVAFTLVLISSTVVGTLGNLLVILTISLVRSLRTCGNMFILNLAVADLVICTVVIPFQAAGTLNGEVVYMGENMLCDVIGSICAPACMSSMWNICFISVNRYVLICHPHLYHRIFKPSNTFIFCMMIWIFGPIAHLPNHLGWGRIVFDTDFYLCTYDVVGNYSFAIYFTTLSVLVPLVGVHAGYTGIFHKVRSVKLQIREHRRKDAPIASIAGTVDNPLVIPTTATHSQSSFTQEDIRLAKTLFMAFIVFLVCWLPFALLVIAGQPAVIPKWIYVVAMIMAHGNSAMNPILYGLSNEKFREGYRKVTGCNLRVSSAPSSLDKVSHPRESRGNRTVRLWFFHSRERRA